MIDYDHDEVLSCLLASVKNLLASGNFGYEHPAYLSLKKEVAWFEQYRAGHALSIRVSDGIAVLEKAREVFQ